MYVCIHIIYVYMYTYYIYIYIYYIHIIYILYTHIMCIICIYILNIYIYFMAYSYIFYMEGKGILSWNVMEYHGYVYIKRCIKNTSSDIPSVPHTIPRTASMEASSLSVHCQNLSHVQREWSWSFIALQGTHGSDSWWIKLIRHT